MVIFWGLVLVTVFATAQEGGGALRTLVYLVAATLIGFTVLGAVLAVLMFKYSRCPVCGRPVSPKRYPVNGVRCEHCGQTVSLTGGGHNG